MKTTDLIGSLKENNQDFEFYPTTKEIVEIIYNDLATRQRHGASYSILDVGCGNGNFFTKFQEIREERKEYHKVNNIDEDSYNFDEKLKAKPIAQVNQKFAIEKSEILISNMPKDVIVVGTDFWQQTLIDKKVNVIFSNPPYSEFEEWSAKIIKEANTNVIYLVIPDRWNKSKSIAAALNARNFEAKTLGNFDFLNAERAARAKVEIIKISSKKQKYKDEYYDEKPTDPFDAWFNEEFKININQKEEYDYEKAQKKSKELKNEISLGKSLISTLTSLYARDMQKLLSNYKAVCDLDVEVLKELGVSTQNLKEGLKQKIKGLKDLYWQELFNNLDKITDRLTYKKRSWILDSLAKKTTIDFTESNIYAVVIWVIKNANQYYDDQLKEIYLELTETEFVKKYKSNQRTWDNDKWRYKNNGTNTHYTLEYRIITHRYSSDTLIGDVRTIANNLGFSYIGDVKTFKNGNVHFRFEKDFIKAFNIEAARLFGWIKKPQDAVDEFDDEVKPTYEEAQKFFRGNFAIISTPQQLLLN